VREIARELKSDLRFQASAIAALQEVLFFLSFILFYGLFVYMFDCSYV
jgi:histone H3/H4